MSLSLVLCILGVSTFIAHGLAESVYSPCPILGPRYSRPTNISESKIVQQALQNLTAALDDLNISGNSSYTQATPNTTTYSIALFDANDISPGLLYEYHHVAETFQNTSSIDASSVYNVGGLSQLLSVYTALVSVGNEDWNHPITTYLPELENYNGGSNLSTIDWPSIRLLDLATQLADIPRDAILNTIPDTVIQQFGAILPAAMQRSPVNSEQNLLDVLRLRFPIYEPATTPIYSNTAFQLLALAVEHITNSSFASVVQSTIFEPLGLSRTWLGTPSTNENVVIPQNETSSGWDSWNGSAPALSAAAGFFSTISDLSVIGRSILRSTLLTDSTTNRWLKPHSYTSNLVNGVGMPFDIYTPTLSGDATGAVIPIFTKLGTHGLFSPYFGLVPDHGVGFVMLSADTNQPADLNAYVDIISEYLIPALERTAAQEATVNYEGNYTSSDDTTSMTLEVDGLGGLSVTEWSTRNASLDIRAAYAKLKNIDVSSLDLRLYPTSLQDQATASSGPKIAWRAVMQDRDAPIDAGTPTCITWEDGVDQFVYNGVSLDQFNFELDANGAVKIVEIPSLNMTLQRKQ